MTSLGSSVPAPSPTALSLPPPADPQPFLVLRAAVGTARVPGSAGTFCRFSWARPLPASRVEVAAPVLCGEAWVVCCGRGRRLYPCASRPQVKRNSTPPLSLFGQLLWREFFYTAATNNPRFDRMEGNPICIQIPWDRNPEALAKWAEGKTGFPWIDAIMTQLRQEGWIHHLARHAVACFLTRGDLWVSWESGVRVSALSVGSPHGG